MTMEKETLRWGVKPRYIPEGRKYLHPHQENEPDDATPEQLDEFRILRGGAALALAAKSKKEGDALVRHAKEGQSILKRDRKDMPVEERISLLNDALDKLLDAQIASRNQLGNLVGISLTSALISERSEKQIQKLQRRN
jgi:hypothetical protein